MAVRTSVATNYSEFGERPINNEQQNRATMEKVSKEQMT
jgi:hypothetical protein